MDATVCEAEGDAFFFVRKIAVANRYVANRANRADALEWGCWGMD
jgi:hypothetical protein